MIVLLIRFNYVLCSFNDVLRRACSCNLHPFAWFPPRRNYHATPYSRFAFFAPHRASFHCRQIPAWNVKGTTLRKRDFHIRQHGRWKWFIYARFSPLLHPRFNYHHNECDWSKYSSLQIGWQYQGVLGDIEMGAGNPFFPLMAYVFLPDHFHWLMQVDSPPH